MEIEEILDDLGVSYLREGNHHCRPGWIQIDCPYCGTVEKYHMGFNLSGRYFNCWKCGGHHPAKVLRTLGVAGEKEAQDLLRSMDGAALDRPLKKRKGLKEPKHRISLDSRMAWAHRQYLRKRGFRPDEIQRIWQVGAISLAAKLPWRLYIPIHQRGQRVSWTTRAIGEGVTQRYVSASAEEESVNHKEVVYGLDLCFHSVVVVEGPTDAWRIGPGAGALFGTAFSPAQVLQLSQVPHRIICFDSSDEAQERAQDLASQLSVFPGSTQNVILDAEDPGEADEKEVKLLREVARL